MKFKANKEKLGIAVLKNNATYKTLQAETGLSQRTIQKVFNGNNVLPKTCNKIADALGVPVIELFERS